MSRPVSWYLKRLRRMSAGEVAQRARDAAVRAAWTSRQVPPGETGRLPRGVQRDRRPPAPVPPGTRERVSPEARAQVLAAADRLLAGDWELLGTARADIVDPDWFADPVTGRRAPDAELAFRIDHRDEAVTGNVKAVWELSRHHHLTVLAAAWWLTGEDRYAEVVAAQLRSWWRLNPFLSGIHWTSGIELGVRLVAWAWVRRLLDGWPGAPALFEENPDALRQIWWHQRYLATFRSHGSSANNHVVAEEAGRVVAAGAFPWFRETRRWGADARRRLSTELRANTFGSGVNRELASDYHRFVCELGLVAAVEADAAGTPLPAATWDLLTASLDAAAAMVDVRGGPPRQGDGDEGRALVVEDPAADPWTGLLAVGAELVGPLPWWRAPEAPGVAAVALRALARDHHTSRGRPSARPDVFEDAGIVLLRTDPADGPEIWCRCDAGPLGFLSIAAHGHADALSVEVRHDGVEVLVDPGTYCYHGEPQWRHYFRSTLAHNTVEVDGQDQSVQGGPFMWSRHAAATMLHLERAGDSTEDHGRLPGPVRMVEAEHEGYLRLDGAVRHRRRVELDAAHRMVAIEDVLTGSGRVRLLLHLGPRVEVRLDELVAHLSWGAGEEQRGALHLAEELEWTAHRGEVQPVLGWYSPRFGERVPVTTLVGSGVLTGRLGLVTTLALPSPVRPDLAEQPNRTRIGT